MKEFKVGDWVIEKSNGELKQIKIGKSECLERKLALYERLCEPWEPKDGEWIICWMDDEIVYTIERFDSMAQYENIAPLEFVNTLKDKQ